MRRVIILIDGGYLRAQARRDNQDYNIDFIEDFAHELVRKTEELVRVFYYDCRPFQGDVALPVSGDITQFKSGGGWLDELAGREHFCVRTGTLKFRGWKPKNMGKIGGTLTDLDFKPDFEQKGIDLRIGLDLVQIIENRAADRVILISADTDLLPAMERVRLSGASLVGVDFPGAPLRGEIQGYFDLIQEIKWPKRELPQR